MAGGEEHPREPMTEEREGQVRWSAGTSQKHLDSPGRLHAEQQLPVVDPAVVVRVPERLPVLPQPPSLLPVDVALHAGLPSADERGVPQGEASQSYRHRAAGGLWVSYLKQSQRQVFSGDAHLVRTQRKMMHL